MKYFRKFGRRRIYRKRAIRRARPVRKVSKSVRTYVKRELHRNIENKERILYANNQSSTCGAIASTTLPLICPLTQGSDNSTRVGNSVKIVSGVMRIAFNLLTYDATTNPNSAPVWIKLWVVRDLVTANQLSSLPSNIYTSFFKGNALALGFQGTMLDQLLDNNTDINRVLMYRQFKLGVSDNLSTTNAFADNSPVSKVITINWAKYVKKMLKFSDNTSYCTNANLYLVWCASAHDGSSNTGKTPIEFHYVNTMKYEDA